MENKIILGIDTSTDNCSVALLKNNKVIAERSEIAKSAHSEKLIIFIGEMLKETDISVGDIDCIGVNIGPGSFTGLRIGLSTAKGLAFTNKIPIYPVKSIPVMIESNNSEDEIFYFIKSHRNMIFYNNYNKNSENLLDLNIEYGDIEEILKENPELKIAGNFNFVENFGLDNKVIFPDGKSVAKLVYKNFDKFNNKTDQNIEPYYLTSFKTQKWSGNKKK